MRQLGCEGDQKYVEAISEQLKVRFAYASTWSQRQSYAFLCGRLVAEQALPLPDWCRLFLPNLILLASDRVPNVRIAVAKMLATHIACLGEYSVYGGFIVTRDKYIELFVDFFTISILQKEI